MRVALVTESFLPSLNGVTNSVLRVVETLKAQGHKVLIVAPTSESPEHEGFPVVTSPFVPLGGFPVAIPTPAITQTLDRFAPDLIHAAAPFWLGGQSIAYAAKKGIPSVAVYQTDVAGYMERYGLEFAGPILEAITAAIHRPATISLAPTQDGKDFLHKIGIDTVELWGRGVDAELFHPERRTSASVRALRERFAPDGERIIGYVGRLAPEKQVARLIEVCGIPNTRVVIVGDGPDRPELEDRFAGYPVTFTGRLSGEELADAYAAMDVFVHCGTEETFGQTIQEAHASGLPVIAPSKGGQRHLIREGIDGYLVDHTQWGAFRDAVWTLTQDDHLRHEMSQNARRAVAGKTWEKNNEALLRYYDRALSTVGVASALAA
ncbi:MAG: glycosyltransferase family 1 protein [Actinomycetota bacterium]|nr:glycosyltransferase family 1 protein [Actinomycetota bacterium]